MGARPVGISADTVGRQRHFADRNDIHFPLLSDERRVVAEQFGVSRRIGPIAVKRHTFVIGTDLRIIEIIRSELNIHAHADRALGLLRARA